MYPHLLDPQSAFVGIAEERCPDRIGSLAASAPQFLDGQSPRVLRVLLDPEGEVVFLQVRLNQIVFEFGNGAADVEVVIHKIVFVDDNGVAAEKLEQILRVIAAVFDPLSAENLPPVEIDAHNITVPIAGDGFHLSRQFGTNALIGVEAQNPRALDREVAQCPIPLLRVRFERMRKHRGAIFGGDRERAVRAA